MIERVPVPHSLPGQATSFIGRKSEIARIVTLFDDPACHLLTLVGPGGIGKTRLALEVAQYEREHFPDGVWFVSLVALTNPDQTATAIGMTLQVQSSSSLAPEEELLQFLHDRQLLLVLDNFEHLMGSVDLVDAIVRAAPAVRVLITSRASLNLQAEWVQPVGGLCFPDQNEPANPGDFSAVQLFAERARKVQPRFSLTQSAGCAVCICQLVEGVPLAIELAASWLKVMPCEAVAEQIRGGLDFLTSDLRDVPQRHRIMRAVFDHSWGLLTPEEQQIFQHFSLFRGGCTLHAAEHVTDATLPQLASLVEKSLLTVDIAGRYQMHELLRQYAEDKLNASGEIEVVRRAHSAYYAKFLQDKWQPLRDERQTLALKEIEVEFGNIVAAWQTMVDKSMVADLSISIYPLWTFAERHGHAKDVCRLFKQAETALDAAAGDKEVERVTGQLLATRGHWAWYSFGPGRVENEERAKAGLAILRRVGSPEDVALALGCMCGIASLAYDLLALKHYAEEMVEIARTLDDQWLLATALFPLANAATHIDDLEEAERLSQAFHECAEACGDIRLKVMSWSVVQRKLANRRGDYAEAKRCCEEALDLLEETGQETLVGEVHRELGLIACHLNNYPLAAQHFAQGLRVDWNVGYQVGIIATLCGISHLWMALGSKKRAVELLTLIVQSRASRQETHYDAEHLLGQLEVELPIDAFAAAQDRGRRSHLSNVVQAVLVELEKLSEAPTPPVASPSLLQLPNPLTTREMEVLHLISEGLSNAEIAQKLVISVATVKVHAVNIYSKLGASSRTQAVALAHSLNLL